MSKRFRFQVVQEFDCSYEVEGETAEEAWTALMDMDAECVDQIPSNITSTFETASIEEVIDV